MGAQGTVPRREGRSTEMDVAQAVLIFILFDQGRLSHFLASSSLTEAELRHGMTHRLAMQVIQYVRNNDSLREICAATGMFGYHLEEADGVNDPGAAVADDRPPGRSITLH